MWTAREAARGPTSSVCYLFRVCHYCPSHSRPLRRQPTTPGRRRRRWWTPTTTRWRSTFSTKFWKSERYFSVQKFASVQFFLKKNISKFFSISLSWSTLSNYLSMVNWPICRIRNVQSRLFKLSLSFSFTFFTSFAQFNSFAS